MAPIVFAQTVSRPAMATLGSSSSALSRSMRPLRMLPVQSRRAVRAVTRAEKSYEDPLQKNDVANFGKNQVPINTESKEVDSFTRLEAPVRNASRPEDGGRPVQDRNNYVDDLLIKNDAPQEKAILNTEVAFPDAMRFKGAAPEVINCRLAMLGFALAVFFETTTGMNVFEQVAAHPKATIGTFLLFIVASLVPILRGQPRYGNSLFKPDVEITVGRTAMLGFAGLVLQEAIRHNTVFH